MSPDQPAPLRLYAFRAYHHCVAGLDSRTGANELLNLLPLDPTLTGFADEGWSERCDLAPLGEDTLEETLAYSTLPYPPGLAIVSNVSQTAGPGQSIFIDIDQNGSTDFNLTVAPDGYSSLGFTSYIQLNRSLITTFFTPGPLNAGDPINLADATSAGGYLMKSQAGPTYSYPWGGVANGSSHFLGLRFDIAGQQHLGWAELSLQKGTPTSVTVLSYGYETEAGQSIVAGDVPEPSSLALFAAGAAGLVALRRRRKAA